MANLIFNKTKEVEVISETRLKGMWKVEVVCPNGEVKKPFGDKMRPNLLMKRGLDMLGGKEFVTSSSIASFMVGAMYGNNQTSPTSRELYTLTNALPMISNDQQTGQFGWSTYNSTNDCAAVPTVANGSMTYTKTYDFLAVPNTQTVTEVIIIGGSLTTQQRNTTQLAGGNVLSRFILPAPVILSQYQFLRLTYSLQVTMPATISYPNIDISSGDFSGYGKLIRVGTFARIFGSMSLTGEPIGYNNYLNNATYRQPWLMISDRGATAILLPGGDAGGNQQPTPPVSPNTDFENRTKLATSVAAHTSSTGGESVDEGYSNSGLSISKRGRILFTATNPLVSSYIGGIYIMPTPSVTIDYTATDYHGWYWQFTDLNNGPRGQFKDQNFALAINFRQTSSIT